MASDLIPLVFEEPNTTLHDWSMEMDVQAALEAAKRDASPCVAKGIDAMIQMSHGYSSREIGDKLGVSAKLICAWISKARKFLKNRPEIRALTNE